MVIKTCTWCSHPDHGEHCTRKINMQVGPPVTKGGKAPTEDRPCPCKRWHWREARNG